MEPDNQEKKRDSSGRWVKGVSGNIHGRPKGKTMKEWAREYLERLTDEERDQFMEGIPKELIWRMSEGNPANNTDVTSGGKPIPLFSNVPINNSNSEDTKPH
jgi:hypothetical protein